VLTSIAPATALLGSLRQTREMLHRATSTYNLLQSSRSLLRSPDMPRSCSASSAVVSVRPTHPQIDTRESEKRRRIIWLRMGLHKGEVANGSRYSLLLHWLCAPGQQLVQLHSRHSRRAHRSDLHCAGICSFHRAAREHEVCHYKEVAGLAIKGRRC
jgi:hypothetical protein